jgi:hypothetical protein
VRGRGDHLDPAASGRFQGLAHGFGVCGDVGDELVDGAVAVGLDAQAEDVATPGGKGRGEGGKPSRPLVDRGADAHKSHMRRMPDACYGTANVMFRRGIRTEMRKLIRI